MQDVRVFFAGSPDAVNGRTFTCSVEAEWGDVCVAGEVVTLAHHGPRSGNPAPCVTELPAETLAALGALPQVHVLVSHIDLDTLGGIFQIVGNPPELRKFWEVAAHVDVHGPHTLSGVSGPGSVESRWIHAWWAWAENHRAPRVQVSDVIDVTEYIEECFDVLELIFQNDAELLDAGQAWRELHHTRNAASVVDVFRSGDRAVVLREATYFTNGYYSDPAAYAIFDGVVGVTCKGDIGTVTISIPQETPGVSCVEIAQALWGPEAGGRDTIAGGPRQGWPIEVAREQARAAAQELLRALNR